MHRLLQELDESPLKKFYSLESNLKRERRVFAIVIALLICVAVVITAMTVAGLFQTSFRQEEQAARIHEKEMVEALLQRRIVLTTASLVLQLHMNSEPIPPDLMALRSCTQMRGSVTDNPVLRESCDFSVRNLANSGQTSSIAMILADGTAGYGHLFSPDVFSPLRPDSPSATVTAILEKFHKRGMEPVDAARKKQIIWFVDGGSGKRIEPHMIGASLILKDDQLYAVVLSSMDVHDLLTPLERSGQIPEPVVIDVDGRPLIEAEDAGLVHQVDEKLVLRQDGLYHWISGFGWALRRPALSAGFGHMVYLLPLSVLLRGLRYELMLICGTAIVLIVLLCVAYRYWNYRFLTRVYSEASRALDTEMLNHLLVHATPVGLCIVRRSNLEIIVANPIARSVMGLRIADKRLPQELSEAFDESLEGMKGEAGDSPIFQFPFALSRPKHAAVHLEITYVRAKLNQQDVFFCAVIDMTAHHQAEILLREAKLTSDAAARAKVAFFASMSHEIRTPLSSLVGNIELVVQGPLAPEQRARVRAMQTSAGGLLQIVNDVLDFSKIDVGELSLMEEWRSIPEVLGRLGLSHAPLAKQQGLKFFMVFDRNIPSRLLFDPIRVSQIVNNLLGNSLKFTQSGKIVLRAAWHDDDLEISVTDSGIGIPDELKHRLFQPFTQGDSNRLTQARGTGLGLSICARLCELMKGRIDLDSVVGVGTRITVTLPLRKSEAYSGKPEWTLPYRRPVILCRAPENREWLSNLFDPIVTVVTAVSNPVEPIDANAHDCLIATDEFLPQEVLAWWSNPDVILWVGQDGPIVPARRNVGGVEVSIHSLSGLKSVAQMLGAEHSIISASETPPIDPQVTLTILIVEDNLLNRSLLLDQLTTLGVRVVEATNGEEAMERLAKERVDAVMTDIDMPVMDGFRLLSELRRLGMRMPVYAVSASARPEDIAEGRARGFNDYLTKPVSLETLEKVIGQLAQAGSAFVATEPAEDELPDVPEVPVKYAEAFLVQATRDAAEFDVVMRARELARLRRWLHGVAGCLAVLGQSALYEQCQELRTHVRESTEWDDEISLQARSIADALGRMVAQLQR